MMRRFVSHVMLAFALLFAQSAGLSHAASHLGNEPAKQEEKLLHLKLCDKCSSFEKLSYGPPAQATVPVRDLAQWVPHQTEFRNADARRALPYRSRAPPDLL
jgi:hypothetical protein